MTDQLPYTYTDPDTGYTLSVSSTHLRIIDVDRVCDEMPAPTGEDAVDMARAFLAAGNTGHIVVSTEDSSRAIRIREALAAESMRERAAVWLEERDLPDHASGIRALPLLPDGDDTESCSWADEDTDDENPPCLAMSPTPDTHVPYGCEGVAGHEEEHHALKGSVTWEDDIDDESARSYSTDPDGTPVSGASEAHLRHLKAEVGPVCKTPQELAQEIKRLINERDRLRTAWEAARENIAKDMRDRAAHAVAEHGESASPSELHRIVTDLPLVPDAD